MTSIFYALAIIGGLSVVGCFLKIVFVGIRDLGLKEVKLSFNGKQTTLESIKEVPLKPRIENPELKPARNRNQKQINK